MKCVEPKGAFYLFLDIRAFGLSSKEFCDRLLEEKIVVCIPGSAFGDVGVGFIRMAYTAETDKIVEDIERINAFCTKLTQEY